MQVRYPQLMIMKGPGGKYHVRAMHDGGEQVDHVCDGLADLLATTGDLLLYGEPRAMTVTIKHGEVSPDNAAT